jgi:pimeloyl-ACP methyl ester carboxylesterase
MVAGTTTCLLFRNIIISLGIFLLRDLLILNKFKNYTTNISALPFNRKTVRRWLIIFLAIYCSLGVTLYFLQDKFLLHPVPLDANYSYRFQQPFREVNVAFNKYENLNMIQFFPGSSLRRGVVLYFHGNAQNINRYARFVEPFIKKGYEVWMPDYPGYGKSTGKLTEQKLYDIAAVVYDMAASTFKPDNIIIYGKSLGTGPASELASMESCRLLILETPYYSIPDLFSYYAPVYPTNIISKYKFPVHQYLQSVKSPVVIFHGDNDDVIPFRCCVKLKNTLKHGDEFITIKGGKHNNLSTFIIFQEKIDSLLRH